MGAGHDHSHGAGDRPDRGLRNRLALAFAITVGIVAAQAIGAVITGSLALLTDTAHALADSTGLLVALIAATMMLRPPSSGRTWGFARIEVLAALGQSVLLIVVGGYAAVEGVRRLFEPAEIPAGELLVFGIIGLTANIVAMLVLSAGRGANLNMRAAFLEVVNDALGSLGVIVAAIVISTTGFTRADTIAGLFIAALIVPRAVRLLRETTSVLMEFTPKGVDVDAVRAHVLELEHVQEVHDLHASMIGTGLPVISAHVVIDDGCFESGHAPRILEEIRQCLREHFPVSFDHATIQLETAGLRERTCDSMEHQAH
ncbi:cation diffusion facilitator family transporter [Janibacter sp. FSL W8-0316]|uniref:Cation transporter n=1 Tax=Janibacter indicus TaxID=857417 RepID=A0A1L3MEX5_9MICO|nr:cation diffusion facilitator family transporter [Janibacter indicus]APH00882.1 cation transporter [Janibacter indicus]